MVAINEYDVGDTVVLRATIGLGTPKDPASLYLVLQRPNGDSVTKEWSLRERTLARDGVGDYTHKYRIMDYGEHKYNFLLVDKNGDTAVLTGKFNATAILPQTLRLLRQLPVQV